VGTGGNLRLSFIMRRSFQNWESSITESSIEQRKGGELKGIRAIDSAVGHRGDKQSVLYVITRKIVVYQSVQPAKSYQVKSSEKEIFSENAGLSDKRSGR